MKIIADSAIPFLDVFFPDLDITLLAAKDITQKTIKNADILIVRSVTTVNKALLENTSIKFVASPTSGHDHIDFDALDALNIRYATAPGCNSAAVSQYVSHCLTALQSTNILTKTPLKIGIVGVGRIGLLLSDLFTSLGHEVLLNDPPRAQNESAFTSTPLSDFADVDLVTIHTPLTVQGDFPTRHLFNDEILASLKPGCIVINTARGAVIDTQAVIKNGQHLHYCFDVYENEPLFNVKLLDRALIATPHIAGHTRESKWRGTSMIANAISDHFNLTLHSVNVPFEGQNVKPNEPLDYKSLLEVTDTFKRAISANDNMTSTFNTFRTSAWVSSLDK